MQVKSCVQQTAALRLLRMKYLHLNQKFFIYSKTTQTRLIQIQQSDLRFLTCLPVGKVYDLRFTILKVYDVLGNEIATLISEEKPIGNYEVKFDGAGLPSGIYFYQIQAGSFVETKKMVLMK